MAYRDPRVLSEKLDNNATNRLTAPPEAESSPEADALANAPQLPGGYVPDNATNRPTSPPSVEQDPGSKYISLPPIEYPAGTHSWNVTRGPDERDQAIDRAKGL